jgi:HEAT repeat protein
VSQAQVVELKTSLDQFRSGLVQRGMLPPGSNEVASLRTVVLNPNAEPEEKVMALRVLRVADARSDDIVKEMIKAYYATEHGPLRADIFRQLDGVTTPELRAPLLEAVSKAAEAEVREEAAETLFHYLPDPDVKAWLEHLAASDPNERVRQQATESIRRYRPRPQ